MIKATQAAFLVATEGKGSAPVRAQLVERTDAPLRIAEHDHVLTQQANTQRRAVWLGDVLDHAGGQPVLPHQLPHWGLALHTAKQIILFRSH
ncbi:hypothetical protein FHS92_003276 [Sphingobium subterraneum]|uniref:Uncharacterized protein n=1 Tax=Sphingobium subterraneum TaxID=627688 RepID=A0A841J594_9SPHN|nr:hypothetical protein [Sphingobium subterraneum]